MYHSKYFLMVSILCQYSVGSDAQVSDTFFRSDYRYFESTQSFYKIHTIFKPWQEANKTCASEGAILFYPEDRNEAAVVTIFLRETQPQYSRVSVGASATSTKGVYKTIEDIPVKNLYNNWDVREPDNGSENCLYMTNNGKIGDWNCSTKQPFICKKRISLLQWNAPCNMPYTDYVFNETLGGCYKLHLNPLNWTDAYAACSAEQTHLAVINSRAEADYFVEVYTKSRPLYSEYKDKDFVENYAKRIYYAKDYYHLGFHNISNESWITIKGAPLASSGYYVWAAGEPNNPGVENCGSMSKDGGLNDIGCSVRTVFICEQEVQNQNTKQLDLFDSDFDIKVSNNIFRSDYRYFKSTQSFYKIHTITKTWKEAKKVCAAEGSVFFFPHNGNEVDVAREFLKETQPTIASVFVGASAILAKGVYETIDGAHIQDLYPSWGWEDGEPNGGNPEDCVYMTKDGKLGDRGCSTGLPFICWRDLASLPWNPCINLDYLFNETLGGCYKLHLNPLNWTDAYAACSAEQTHLAVINSRAEADYFVEVYTKSRPLYSEYKDKDFVENYAKRIYYAKDYYHLGFHNISNESWITIKSNILGAPLASSGYYVWAAGEPNNPGVENCGSMYKDGKLNDIGCSVRTVFICEHEVQNQNTKQVDL